LLPTAIDKLNLTPGEIGLLRKYVQETPAGDDTKVEFAEEFTIVGVIRQSTEEEWKERRWWDEGYSVSDGAVAAAPVTDLRVVSVAALAVPSSPGSPVWSFTWRADF
jgi:hypothetical protein